MRKRCLLISIVLLILSASLPFFAQESSPPAEKGKLRVIELKGTPYARGRTHGQSLRPEIQPAAPQNYVIGGPKEVASFERSAGRMAEFSPFERAEFTYHTNHPIINDDFNPKFVEGLKKRGMTLEAYKARCPRFKFLGETFKDNSATLDLAVLKRIFSDRNSGINNARTYGCTIMVLGDRPELHIAPGRPDTEPFVKLDFERRRGSSVVSTRPDSGKIEIRFGVCDWTIQKGGNPAALELAAKLGLDGVQVSLNPKGDSLALGDPKLQQVYLAAAEKNKIQIASFAIGELNNVPLKSDPRAEKWLAEGIDIAAAMKVKAILVPFFGRGDLKNDPAGTEAVIAAVKRLAPKADKAGVILALESWLSAEDHLRIIRAIGSPAVRVYYDVGNSQEAGYDIFKEIRQLGAQICEFHAKDYKDLYGKGSMDFPAVRAAMEDIGYSGWLVMEGIKLPLGIEQSILYDLNYLKSVFAPSSSQRKI